MLETAVGAISAPTRFSLVRISVRDLVADGKSLVRNSGVGGGGQTQILMKQIGKGEGKHLLFHQSKALCIAVRATLYNM